MRARAKWAIVRPWLIVAGSLGVGLLPCPDCGVPIVLHYWPVAIGIAIYRLAKHRLGRPDDPFRPAYEQKQNGV